MALWPRQRWLCARKARQEKARRTLLAGPERLEDRQMMATWSGDITTDTTWTNAEVQRVTGNVRVVNGATLTIQPGTVVKFNANLDLNIQVDGQSRILAQGTAENRIHFTTSTDDTVGGDTNGDGNASSPFPFQWQALFFNAGTANSPVSVLDHVEVRYGGENVPAEVIVRSGAKVNLSNSTIASSATAGLRIEGSNPTLTNVTFKNNVGPAASMDLAASPSIIGVTMENNLVNALRLDGGTLPADATWDDPTIVYAPSGTITIPAGRTLTIAPDQIVKFTKLGDLAIQVNGTLLAQGTEDEPIIFTSLADDLAGGDSNANGQANGPAGFDWRGLMFNPGSTGSVLDHVEVRYGGENVPGAVVVNGAQLALTNSTIQASATAGIRIENSNPSISDVVFSNNVIAASMDMGSNPAINNVSMLNNGVNALQVDGGPLTADVAWNDPDVTYLLNFAMTVPAGKTLSIAPGQVVKFRERVGAAITVNGTLSAVGTAGAPIILTSSGDDSIGGDTFNDGIQPNTGFWNDLRFQSSSSNNQLQHVEVRYAGSSGEAAVIAAGGPLTISDSKIISSLAAGVRVLDTTSTISNVEMRDNLGPSIRMNLSGEVISSGIASTNSGPHAVVIDGGTLLASRSLAGTGLPYRLGGNVSLASGTTLTIGPGATFEALEPVGISGSGTVANAGLIRKSIGSTSTFGSAVVNTGTIQSLNSTLNFAGGLTNNGNGAVTGPAGPTIAIAGNLVGSTQNAAAFAPLQTILLNGAGTQAAPQMIEALSADRGASGTGFERNFDFFTLALAGGTYVKLVDNADNAAGSGGESVYTANLVVPFGATLDLNNVKLYARTTQINGTVTGGNVTIVPDGGPLARDAITPGRISAPGEIDDWTLFGRAGETLTINLSTGGSGPTSPIFPPLFFGQVTLVGPNNQTIISQSTVAAGSEVILSNVNLPADGAYHIKIQAPQAVPNSTGNYVLTAWNATINTSPMELGKPVFGRLDSSFSSDRFTFSAVAGQAVKFKLLKSESSAIVFDLTGPNGYTAFNGATASSDTIVLPSTGTYAVTVRSAQSQQTGAYAFQVDTESLATLTLGTPLTIDIAGSGQTQLFKVSVPQQQQLLVSLTDANAANRNEVYVKQGSPPTRSDFQFRFDTPAAANQQVAVPTAAPGDWFVLVYTDLAAQPGSATLLVKGSSIFASDVTPDVSGTAADTTLTITGLGFDNATSVSLISAGNQSYPATNVRLDLPTQITARFAANSVPAGTYSVQVRSAANDTSTLPAALTMNQGGKANFVTNIVLPTAFGYHVPSVFYVEYANTGDLAMPAPMLLVTPTQKHADGTVDSKALLTLNAYTVAQGFWGSADPLSFGHTMKILASGETPGVLQPGESRQVPVYWAGWKLPYDLSYPPFDFNIKVVTADEPTVIDWVAFQNAVKAPPLTPAFAWAAIWKNLQLNVGATWGDYVKTLDRNAAYLGQLGIYVNDISELVGFEFSQADGLSLNRELAETVDVAIPAPGIPLTVSRSFANTISQRHTAGPFGGGWSFEEGWYSKLYEGTDGTVAILGPNGEQSIFKPDSRGGYFNLAGDNGVLSVLGGGKYAVREPNGNVTAYDSVGRVDYVEDANGNRVTASWAFARLTKLTHSAGQTLTFISDQSGRIASITDSDGLTTQYAYSGFQLASVTDPYGRVTQYNYSVTGAMETDFALTSVKTPDGVQYSFSYDVQGRLNETHLGTNQETLQYAYGAGGAVTTIDTTGAVTTIYLDHRGLIAKIDDPLHRNAFYTYDDNLRLTESVDAAGQRTTFSYDTLGNLVSQTDPLGHTTRYTYSGPFNRLNSITDPNGNTIRDSFDSKGNEISTTYPDGSIEQRAFDPVGNVVSRTNRRGQVTNYTYNADGLLSTASFSDGTQTTFVYDTHHNLTSATSPAGTTTLAYDAKDQLTQVTYPGGLFLKYEYDDTGRRTRMTDQANFAVNYIYDTVGRLAGLKDAGGTNIATYTYNNAGQLTRKDNGNQTYTTYEFDAAGQLLHLINHSPGNTVSSQFDYSYDVLGRIKTMSTLDGQWTYAYDAVGQLTRAVFGSLNPAAVPNQDLQYAYDPAGNRTSAIVNGVVTTYSINNLNQYTSAGSTNYTYDADGNQISASGPGGIVTYSYDTINRLTSVTSPADNWSYQYDATGQRIGATYNGVTTGNLIDPIGLGTLVGEFNGTTPIARYTYGIGLTSRVDAAGSAAYYNFDALGNTVAVTGAGGAVVNSYRYLPFGALLSATGNLANSFQFGGAAGVMAETAGRHFMRARFYDAALGRFMQRDPIGAEGGLNLYRYVGNDPVNGTDPTGLADTRKVAVKVIKLALTKAGLVDKLARIFGAAGGAIDIGGWSRSLVYFSTRQLVSLARAAGVSEATLSPLLPRTGFKVLQTGISSFANGSRVGGILARGGIAGILLLDFYIAFKVGRTAREYIRQHTKSTGDFLNSWDDAVSNLIGRFLPNSVGDFLARNVGSVDPNQKIGPGFGAAGFVSADQILPYRIDFENDKDATAPAQKVVIRDLLSPNFDWDTFELTEIQFGDTQLAIPAGSQHFATTVQVTQNGTLFDVLIQAGLRAATGEVFAIFQSIDPTTQLPPDVLIGFLPPEDGKGHGQGHVSYTIKPKSGLTTGTPIRNVALITFDFNLPISTDQVDPHDPAAGIDTAKQALVTIDAGMPTSSITPLATLENSSFTVKWNGTDDAGGSGVGVYTVFVSRNNGPFELWQSAIPATSARYTGGVAGDTYAFYVVAADNVGNAETKSAIAETQTRISTKPWTNALYPLDVDGDEFAVAGDALTIINYLNTFGSQLLPSSRPEGQDFLDPNGDGSIAPDDALEIINDINSRPGPEGEAAASRHSFAPAALGSQANAASDDLISLLALDVASQPKRRR